MLFSNWYFGECDMLIASCAFSSFAYQMPRCTKCINI